MLNVRRYSDQEFAAQLVEEYWDSSGNKVSACSKCQQKQLGNLPPISRERNADEDGYLEDVTPPVNATPSPTIDPTKPWVLTYQEADDPEMGGFMMVLPASLSVTKYKFYFAEPGSTKPVSNIVEGVVSEL